MYSYKKDFFSLLAQTSPEPMQLDIKSAKGSVLTDRSGKKYIDLISGVAVSNLGHCNPAIVKAIKKQADQYTHLMVYGEMIQAPQVLFAKELVRQLPRTLNSVYFVNSGSEAVEGALKLAKRHTGRTEIIAFRNAYHGSTHGALSVMGDEVLKSPFRPLLPDVRFLDLNDKKGLEQITENTACVIIEPIQGEAGIQKAETEFLTALRKRCSAKGALLLFDEIQSGFGRTGKLFAFQHYGISPDILILGKALGGGLPLGAFIGGKSLMDSLASNPALGHITTFGGHPLSCAAGLAALEQLIKFKYAAKAQAKGKLFRSLLKDPAILEIRGIGLMLAVQFENEQLCKKIIQRCLANGLISDWFLFCPSAIRIAPPLIISEAEIKRACKLINLSIEQAIHG